MGRSIENLENAFEEMFDFITDLPSGLDGFESDFDSAFEELKGLKSTLAPQNEWVNVEDRMPEDDAPAKRKQITVLVTTTAGKVTIASRVLKPEMKCGEKVFPAKWGWSRWLNNYVTHWMFLPAPPGKDNNVPTKEQNEPPT